MKRKRYLMLNNLQVELHEAPHIHLRQMLAMDYRPDGTPYQQAGRYKALILDSALRKAKGVLAQAQAIPVVYATLSDDTVSLLGQGATLQQLAYGRWHINTDEKGMGYVLPDGQKTTTKLYWTRPIYALIDNTVFQGTQKWFPSKGSQYPADLSDLEAKEAYTKLYEGARRLIREMEARGEINGIYEFQQWRLKKASAGLKRIPETL